ncbi:nebulin-like, partial [Varanus komodoensis]|uniref:nebulin-like n=1 Tax=Varanus komodoensis TaxID=61221 RepID=UPI001CF79E52
MADEEEYDEVVEYYIEEEVIEDGEPGEVITEITETTYTTGSSPYTVTTKRTTETSRHGTESVTHVPETRHTPSEPKASPPVRKKVVRKKVDTSKFLTPYLDHSSKMQKLFSDKKYKEKFEKQKGKPVAITTDTPEHRRIKKVQDQLSEVKYRMAGDQTKTDCHVDEKARDIEHAKKVSQQVSKVLYKQNWEDNKEKYLLPPDAPEFVQAIKNTALFSKKLYTEDWEADKAMYYPYDDSPELRRVAKAQKSLSDIVYKKGHDERKAKYTPLPDPPDVELAKKVTRQLSAHNYHEDYNKKKGQWSQTPCYDVAIARMNSDNLNTRKYQEEWENQKDQIYFMQTETPEYAVNKRAGVAASKVKYKEDYEKSKAAADYNVLPATENPLLRHLKAAGNLVNDRLYKEAYEKAKGKSINYCETPKYQIDNVLKNFSDVKYKEGYQNVLGRYIGSPEDPYLEHCMKVESIKSDKNYKADYEDEKANCYFPQTITQEYEVMKKLDQCKDHAYKKHPDKIKFTQVPDSPVLVQAQINSKQLSDLNYKAKHEAEKFRCSIPPDAPLFLQSRVNAYNASDNWYKYDWEQSKAKKFDIKLDAIPIIAAKAKQKIASDVEYKKGYEQSKGKLIGALSIEDDPKMLLSRKVTQQQSDLLYKEAYEKSKGKSINYCETPKYQIDNVLKNFSDIKYKEGSQNIMGRYIGCPEDPYLEHCMKVESIKSDKNYKADYEDEKARCYFPQTITQEYEVMKKLDQCKDHAYKKHPDKIKFTQVPDSPVLVQAQINSKQLSDLNYKAKHEAEKFRCSIPPDAPLFLQSRVNAYNASDNWYKYDWEQSKAKKFDIKVDAIPIIAAKAKQKIASDVEYKKGYEQSKGKLIGALSIEDDPKMMLSRKATRQQSDLLYKEAYEKSKGKSINYCETPKYQLDNLLKNFSEVKYKEGYQNVLGRYIGSYEDPYREHCMKIEALKSDKNYKADYEDEKARCYFPQTITQEYEAIKKLDQCKDYTYKKHPDKIKFTQVADSPVLVQAQTNSKQLSDLNYKAKHEAEKSQCSIPPDAPLFLQSRVNAYNISDNWYKYDWEQSKAKKFDIKVDAIPILAAKAKQKIASDVEYKKGYEQSKGKLIGALSIEDDPKMLLSRKVAKQQSDLEYKKGYEASKARYTAPLDMVPIVQAKKAQEIISNADYKHIIHNYSYPPDSINVELAKKANLLQSDNEYKADYNSWMKGCGWVPYGSLDAEKVKRASDIISERKYRQHPDTLKFTQIEDDPLVVQAKINQAQRSDYQYKKDYERSKGKLVGFRSLQDDPKLVHYMNVAKMQSEREYKKAYEDSKTKYNTPFDMVNVVAAKKAQEIASNANYKNLIHHYTYLPDAMSVELSKNMMNIQSENLYRDDYNNWMKGIGWIPIGSLDVETARKAGEALNEKKYRQHPDTIKFTSVVDSPVMVQAKQNALQLSDRLYKSSGEEMKHTYHMPADAPQFIQARYNAANLSEAYYKHDYHDLISKGHNVLGDAIPIKLAKASRNIASDYKYKEAYEKARGKHVGFRSLQDDPKLVHSMNVAKMQSEREYRKDYEKSKTCYHTPVEMVSIQAAKQAQDVASNANYKHLLHHYTYLPDAMNVELARNMMQIQSDNVYKQDYNSWFKGIGWSPLGSLDVETVRKAGEALNEKKYRQHPDTLKFTSLIDSMPMTLAQKNTKQLSDINYKVEGEKVKHKYHLDPDVPQFIQARVNAYNLSDHAYKADLKKLIAKGYDMKSDAIPIIAAKASRNIASDYKYKESYEKDKGKQVGFRSLQDDPKLVHYMNVAKLQSEREYRKDYESSKTKYHSPLDMFSVVAAKKAQDVATEMNYRQYLHNYTLLPDAMSVELSRNRMQIQSDNLYKTDFNNWLKGIGWVPIQSLEVEKAKKATDILSEKKYRQHPDTLKYTIDMDAMEQVLAKQNAHTMNKRLYVEKWNKEKTDVHVMPDTPDILLSKANQITMSDKLYKSGWEEEKKKGYDLRPDAISIKAAKASRDIASDYKYKLAFEQAKGKHIGFRSLEDDPKLVHFMQVAKMQSEREYKKDYESSKTRFHTPVDMFSVVAAKKAQEVATDVNYRNIIHSYNVLPDAMNLELAKNMMQIQSDNQYKADYDEFMKGVGWMPLGSLEAEKNKKAMEIVSEKNYRQHPDKLKFSILMDSMPMVLATKNAKIMDERLYTEAWEKDKTTIHVMPDTPEIMLAKLNKLNYSEKLYKLAMEESKKKGHDLRVDAIPIQAAKASRIIASDYKYKEGYRKQLGHHVGARSIEDDPKLVHSMNVAKMQSEREYKKDFMKWKTKYSSPVDMLGILLAKNCQKLVSDIDYRNYLHQWTCLPDQNDVIQAKKAYELQSDVAYKSDLEWLKGIGWIPSGSMEVEKVKRAGEILSDRKYRQPPDQFKFTSITDSLAMELAKHNAETMNKRLYTEAWDADKTSIHVMPDTPEILLAKANSANISRSLYIQGWEETKKKGYDLRADAIPIKAAKASRDIASDYQYKLAYEKQRGHCIGFQSVEDDPKMLCSINAAKIQSDRLYKQDFEKWKTRIHCPVDMLSILLAKNCQSLVSDVDYRRHLHEWTCLPDQNDIIHAKKAYDLQSDNVYKSDLEWLRGIGWIPEGSLDVLRVKKAQEILNERFYRQRPETLKFTSVVDSPDIVLAKTNALHQSGVLYRELWDKEKTQFTLPVDTPEIILSKVNSLNVSKKHYQLGWEEAKRKGHDLRLDAIEIQHAKASRNIASEYKYKEGYRKQLGHHVGCRDIYDDPKMVLAMHVAKLQSEREYKKHFEKYKTKFNSPVDMLSILLAKNCQKLVSDIDYHHYLHEWTCLPDQNDVIQAKKAYELQSDNLYKSDLEWLRGIGWMPEGSVGVVHAKNAQDLINERLYKQPPDALKFTSIADPPPVILAKTNSQQISDRLYREAWDKDKIQISIPVDTPVMLQSKINALNISNKHYTGAWDEAKAKGYDIRADAIPIKHARASRDIASEYKYKETHEKQKGH